MFNSILHKIASVLVAPFLIVSSVFSPTPVQAPVPHVVVKDYSLDIYNLQQSIESLQNQLGTQNSSKNLGATLPIPTVVSFFQTSLQSAITASQSSMTLVSALDQTGTTLANSTYGFVIDEGTASQETVLADCNGITCTNLQRGIDPITGVTSVTALQFAHRRGASVKITDAPQLLILSRIMNGQVGFPNKLNYTAEPTFTTGTDIIDKTYADSLAFAGAPNASEIQKGISQLATKAQAVAGTSVGSSGARLVLPASMATSTGASGTTTIPVTGTGGKLAKEFIDQTVAYTWSGTNIFSATNTMATTTMASTTISNGFNLGTSASISGIYDYQVFTASSTWTKPSNLTGTEMVRVQVWGAGGSGGGATGGAGNVGGGGGGGAFVEAVLRASDITSPVTVTIGSGGTSGSAGGNTTFGSYITAYGGGGGSTASSVSAFGGAGGGGTYAVGVTDSTTTGGAGGAPLGGAANTASTYGGGGGGSTPNAGSNSIYGGGGGGGGVNSNSGAGVGGNSLYGGGGGGGGANVTGAAGGTSILGGTGGAGAGGAGNGLPGSAPGGAGGGADSSGTGGAGARGEVRVWIIK